MKSGPLFRLSCIVAVFFLATSVFGQTVGALGNGVSSRSMSLAGTTVAAIDSPLEAMQSNPAGLTELNGRTLDLNFTSMFTTGNFTNSVSNSGSIAGFAGAMPYGAFGMPLGHSGRWKLGVSVAPDTMMNADWTYMDPPGGLNNTTYGLQRNRSAILDLRTAGGLG